MTQTKIGVGMINATSIGDAKVLQGDGAWVTPSAGALTFISSTDISAAATYNFTAVNASSYDSYMMQIHNLIPVDDNRELHLRTSTDGGSTYDSGGSDYFWSGTTNGAHFTDTSDSQIQLNISGGTQDLGSAANEDGYCGTVWIHAPHLTKRTMITWTGGLFAKDGFPYEHVGTGARLESADVDAWQLLFHSGNIESGTVNVYGLANA